MKLRHIALAFAGATLLATPALAGKVQELGTGGKTIAGPSKLSMGASETRTIIQGLDQVGNPQICATAQVTSKSGDVQVDLVENATVSITVSSGDTATLCGIADRVDLTCVGSSCAVVWRVDTLL